ncbi:MAG: hypothetical protein ABIK44_03875, partial [candidate division WOR-3 bacterium]
HEVTLLGLWGSDHIVIEPGANVTEQSQWTRFRSDRYIFGAGWQTLFGDLGYGKLLLSTASTGWHAALAADSLFGDTLVRQHSVEQSLTGRYDLTFRWHQNHETQAGFSLSRTPFNYDVWLWPDTIFYYLYDTAGIILDSFPLLDSLGRPVVRGFSSAGNFHGLKLAGYLQHRLGIFNIAHLTIGLRSDHFTYTDHFYFSPRLGIVTNPLFAGFSLNLGYGIHYQPPQFYILAYDSAANRRLHSRRSDHYIIGIERLFGSEAKLSVEGYYKRLSHLPIPKSWTTPDPYDLSGTYLDIGRGTAQGVELFLQKKFTHNWNATIAYSYSQSRITNPRDTTRTVPGEFDYRHLLTTTATYRVPFHTYQWYQRLPGWFRATIGGVIFSDEADFGLRFRYAGGRPYTPMTWLPETRTWAENGDSIYAARYPDYLRLDLRWSHKFLYRKWSLSWYLDIQNVLDRQNIWFYDYQSDGNIEPVYQLRFWPVAGMIIEF